MPIVRRSRSWAKSNKYVGRYLEDVPFKVSVSLYGSLAVNALYVLLNALYSVMYVSAWFATLAGVLPHARCYTLPCWSGMRTYTA